MANSMVKEVLENMVTLQQKEDGQVKGSFNKLNKKHFSSAESFELYKSALVYAVRSMAYALEQQDEQEKNRLLNDAREKWILPAYKIIEKECLIAGIELPEHGFTVGKRHVRAWIADGGLLRITTDYSTGQRARSERSWSMLAKYVERDIADIIAGRVRIGDDVVYANKTNSKHIERMQKKAEKAAAEKEKAEAEAAKAAEAEAEKVETEQPAA